MVWRTGKNLVQQDAFDVQEAQILKIKAFTQRHTTFRCSLKQILPVLMEANASNEVKNVSAISSL